MAIDEGSTCCECTRLALSQAGDVEVVSHHAINIVLVAGRPVALALVVIEELVGTKVYNKGKGKGSSPMRGRSGVHIMPLR